MFSLKALLQKHKQFLLYCVCGGSGVCTDYIVYYLLVEFGIWYQAANTIGYLAGTLLSFVLNRSITFNMKDKTGTRLALFLTTAAIGFVASALLLWLLVDIIAMDARIAKALTLPMVVILQFTLNKRFTFKTTSPK